MKCNVDRIDRGLRALVGLAGLSLVLVGPQSFWGLLGLIPLAIAAFRYCPNYALMGLSTCKQGSQSGQRSA